MKTVPKEKLCANEKCDKIFKPVFYSTQMVCSKRCEYEYKKFIADNRRELEKEESYSLHDNSIKHCVWIKAFEAVFNAWVKHRDKDKPCITCGSYSGPMEAGHCYSVASYPNLRFHEFNVNKQCWDCNHDKRGDLSRYIIELPKRIGMENYLQLLEYKNVPLKLSIPEIKEQINNYKLKIKELCKKP